MKNFLTINVMELIISLMGILYGLEMLGNGIAMTYHPKCNTQTKHPIMQHCT